jgi:hypothetical protein
MRPLQQMDPTRAQESAFGAFLDVAIDNLTRGVLWSWACPGPLAAGVMALEALTFTCTHQASAGLGCTATTQQSPQHTAPLPLQHHCDTATQQSCHTYGAHSGLTQGLLRAHSGLIQRPTVFYVSGVMTKGGTARSLALVMYLHP